VGANHQVRMPGVRASLKLLQGSELHLGRPPELSSKFPRHDLTFRTRQQTIPTHRLLPVSYPPSGNKGYPAIQFVHF
jgi:hypothetical protein